MRTFTTLLLLLACGLIFSQETVKYPLVEHFTNTRCPICASRNPAFYQAYEAYEDGTHHIAIHPRIPYPSCEFYQANTTDNDARADFYGIFGTPTIYIDGTRSQGSNLFTTTDMENALGQPARLEVRVREMLSPSPQAIVDVIQRDDMPASLFGLYVALVEKEVDYAAPNGETVHHDVFRKFLSDPDGENYSPVAIGEVSTFTFDITYDGTWNPSQLYVLAWVQDQNTKEVYNSGTRFDPVSSTGEQPLPEFSIFPNPVQEKLILSLPQPTTGTLRLMDVAGRVVFFQELRDESGQVSFLLPETKAGVYLLQLQTAEGSLTRKVVKE